jgi:hypothetical protein
MRFFDIFTKLFAYESIIAATLNLDFRRLVLSSKLFASNLLIAASLCAGTRLQADLAIRCREETFRWIYF